MKNRRVGMFTFGVMLIISGITFFIAKIFSYQILFEVVKYWPIILFILGAEVMVNYYSSKENIRYDFASFFMMIMTLGILLGAATVDYILQSPEGLRFRNHIFDVNYTNYEEGRELSSREERVLER